MPAYYLLNRPVDCTSTHYRDTLHYTKRGDRRTPVMTRVLILETKTQQNKTTNVGILSMAPLVDEDYWLFRVRLSDKQSIVGFPKFSTIGIGFSIEDDWNTNLPYTCPAKQIYHHIKHNKGDAAITWRDCMKAIIMVQGAAIAYQDAKP